MSITQKDIKKLAGEGLTSDSSARSIKSKLRSLLGIEEADSDTIDAVRAGLESVEGNTEMSEEEAMSAASKALKQMKADDKRYDHVTKVVEATAAGRPARVEIKCTDPQVDGEGNKICAKTREIAIQDAFQVIRCEPCQGRVTQLYRNNLARLRRQRQREAPKARRKRKQTA